MDPEGLPKKIYRHILSAISYFNHELHSGESEIHFFFSKFHFNQPTFKGAYLSGIILLVKYFNFKLKPVEDIEITIELCLVKLQAFGLIIRKNNLFYLEREITATIKSQPLNNIIEGEIPLNPESRISTEGCEVKLEKSINFDY